MFLVPAVKISICLAIPESCYQTRGSRQALDISPTHINFVLNDKTLEKPVKSFLLTLLCAMPAIYNSFAGTFE